MCGIAGVVSTTRESNITEALVHRMCNQIVYRGPDAEGLYVADGAGLGMRRLSIIDLSGGHQPVFNEDRSSWIVYNGEIYNFLDLRPELESRGHRFRTHCDTEVIIHLYEEMGADCVKKLRGMFALAIYDKTKRKLILARDRLGKKPLHYALHDGNLYFASEIKSTLAVAPELAEVNSQRLLEYLYYGYVPDPITVFTGIHKLPPGHLLEFQDGKIRIRQYWDLPEYNTRVPKNEEECLGELEQRLFEATKIRLISDVPLGAFLSGGTDSSTIVALMARASSGPVKTFSIGFKKDDFNEANYARIVARKFNTDQPAMILERSDDPANVLRRYFAQAPAKDNDLMGQLLYVDAKTYMVGDILTKVDRMSMLNSLEVRVPILDHVFVEWVAGLPPEWKLRGNRQKYILRKLAERVGVPREALYRQKQGFTLPLVHWMRNELKDMLMILLEPRTLDRGYFAADGVRKLMDDHLLRGKTMTGRIWRLLMFELWHRNFLEKYIKPAGLFSLPVVADSRRQAPSSAAALASTPVGG